jgi:hypothetical protein
MPILGALVLLSGAGCATQKKPSVAAAPPPVPVSGTDLDQTNVERVRAGETLKAYPIGRYVDPNDPDVMHESHVVYRKETGASWNLAPNAPTVVPLGPVLACGASWRVRAEFERSVLDIKHRGLHPNEHGEFDEDCL